MSEKGWMPNVQRRHPKGAVKGSWYLATWVRLTWFERLLVLFGRPVSLVFYSPDGQCHAACEITAEVGGEWPSITQKPEARIVLGQ